MNTRMAVRVGTLLGVVALAFFALGKWMVSQGEPQPLAWKTEYQDSLWEPLQERSLTLGAVRQVLPDGRLWLISAENEPRLVNRHRIHSDGQQWRAQAVIALDQEQLDSLVAALQWQPGTPDQPVNPAIAEAMTDYSIERISMIPQEPVDLQYILGTFGPVEVRMPVDVGEAWIYGGQGVVVAVNDDLAVSIMFGIRDRL